MKRDWWRPVRRGYGNMWMYVCVVCVCVCDLYMLLDATCTVFSWSYVDIDQHCPHTHAHTHAHTGIICSCCCSSIGMDWWFLCVVCQMIERECACLCAWACVYVCVGVCECVSVRAKTVPLVCVVCVIVATLLTFVYVCCSIGFEKEYSILNVRKKRGNMFLYTHTLSLSRTHTHTLFLSVLTQSCPHAHSNIIIIIHTLFVYLCVWSSTESTKSLPYSSRSLHPHLY